MGSIPTGPTVDYRVEGDAVRRAGGAALGVGGVWVVVAVVRLGVAAADGDRHGHEHEHGNGGLLFVLIGVPVMTWIGAHLLVALCLWRGQRWARVGAVVAFGVSGLLPLWLFPLHRAGVPGVVAFANAVLCAVVVMLAFDAAGRPARGR